MKIAFRCACCGVSHAASSLTSCKSFVSVESYRFIGNNHRISEEISD